MSVKSETRKYFIAKSKAVRTREDKILKHEIGQEIDVVAGKWVGQDGWKTEAWSEYSPNHYASLESAQNDVKNLSGSEYGLKIVPNTVRYFEIEVTTITTETEIEVNG